MPKAGGLRLRSEELASQKFHDKALNASFGPHQKSAESKDKLNCQRRVSLDTMLQNKMKTAFCILAHLPKQSGGGRFGQKPCCGFVIIIDLDVNDQRD
jgi:hypothetical protein